MLNFTWLNFVESGYPKRQACQKPEGISTSLCSPPPAVTLISV